MSPPRNRAIGIKQPRLIRVKAGWTSLTRSLAEVAAGASTANSQEGRSALAFRLGGHRLCRIRPERSPSKRWLREMRFCSILWEPRVLAKSTFNNRLIAALPPPDIDRYFSGLAPVSLSLREVLLDTGAPIEKRLARWLLTASDRTRSDVMPMTHDFLATMLGVRRTGVTDTASRLQRSGLIQYRRGQIHIIDRAGLEATACECYGLDRDRF